MQGDGSVAVDAQFTPVATTLPDPLRVGMMFSMPTGFTDVEWYGKGPHESYWDRQAGAALGRWAGRISEQNHDYMRPQETGNKVGVRWLTVRGSNQPSLTVTGRTPLSVNVLAFPYEDLSRRPPGTWHSSDIRPHGAVTLLVDAVITQSPQAALANAVRIFVNVREGRPPLSGVESTRSQVIFRENLP